jgi:hypothetical protein
MADVDFAIACKKHSIPMICIARHEGWLQSICIEHDQTLYDEYKSNDGPQTQLLQQNVPWGAVAIHNALMAINTSTGPACPFAPLLNSSPLAKHSFK